ncbi:MAG: hypothetical protein WCC22_07515 [Terriglobales bacterium]
MNRLAITGLYDRGVANKERLHITARVDANLSFYVVMTSNYSPNRQTVMAGSRLAFWFNAFNVKAGDSIILYTGPGSYTTSKRPDGGTDHFFYWGLPSTLWANPDGCAVLCELNAWETK